MSEKLTLLVCHVDDGGPAPHACRRAQRALRENGHDFEKVVYAKGHPFGLFTKGRRPEQGDERPGDAAGAEAVRRLDRQRRHQNRRLGQGQCAGARRRDGRLTLAHRGAPGSCEAARPRRLTATARRRLEGSTRPARVEADSCADSEMSRCDPRGPAQCFRRSVRHALDGAEVGEAVDRTTDGVFLTGATGFVGMELLARYLERTDRRVYALVRGADDGEVAARMRAHAALPVRPATTPTPSGWSRVRGDITRPGLGLRGQARRARRAGERDRARRGVRVLRARARRHAREINVEGTRRVLEFAERCHARGGLRRFSYISTAYVAGEHAGCFSEDDLDVGQRFRNAYEQSKFEAECMVARCAWAAADHGAAPEHHRRRARQRLDGVVQRPLLAVARVLARRLRRRCPRARDAPVDVVPVDYVADAIFALSQAPEAEGAHLPPHRRRACEQRRGAGRARDGVLQAPAAAPDRAGAVPARRCTRCSFAAPRDERHRRALTRSEVFFPYFAMAGRISTIVAPAWRCAARGIEPPPLRAYFDRLVEFALAAEWGRRPIARAGAAARAPRRAGRRARRAARRSDRDARLALAR